MPSFPSRDSFQLFFPGSFFHSSTIPRPAGFFSFLLQLCTSHEHAKGVPFPFVEGQGLFPPLLAFGILLCKTSSFDLMAAPKTGNVRLFPSWALNIQVLPEHETLLGWTLFSLSSAASLEAMERLLFPSLRGSFLSRCADLPLMIFSFPPKFLTKQLLFLRSLNYTRKLVLPFFE